MKINCIIIEDEPASRDVLRKFITEIPSLNLVEECKNAIEANVVLRENDIELIFLDVNMPLISGLDFYKALKEPPMVILTTAYSKYAVEGFEINAIDYLLKPFSFERFLKAVNKIFDLRESNFKENTTSTIVLKCDKKLYRISIDEIKYLQSIGDYVKVFYEDKSIIVHTTIKGLLEQLNTTKILRIHKSYAISLDKFEHIEGNSLSINGESLPIGSKYKNELLKKIHITLKS